MAGVAQRYNVSLDSPSPLLSYSPAALWRPMKPADDGLSALYANGSTAAVTGTLFPSVKLVVPLPWVTDTSLLSPQVSLGSGGS